MQLVIPPEPRIGNKVERPIARTRGRGKEGEERRERREVQRREVSETRRDKRDETR